jgi:hypothetical protein
LFNARTDNEGIHTIQMGDRNKVLMFESEDDATRYALLLEAQDFPTPSIEALDSEEIEQFCREANYDWEIIGEGMLEIPPDKNVEDIDWNEEDDSSKTEAPTDSELSESELEKIRRRLEGLL